MPNKNALARIAKNASANFDSEPFVRRETISLSNVYPVSTNGIAIECGEFSRGSKSFYFCIWLDQLVHCAGDSAKQEYFWYGIFGPSKGAVRDLSACLPVNLKPSHARGGKGKPYLTQDDLKRTPKPGRGTFKQYKDALPKGLLGKVIEERYSHGAFLGRFVERGLFDARRENNLAKQIRSFWRELTAAASKSARQGTASTTKKYKVKVKKKYEVFPTHTALQASFEKWVNREWPNRFAVEHNDNLADTILMANKTGKVTLVEVKPASAAQAEFAAREAVGQLLQYRFDLKGAASMAVVLGASPSDYTKKFLKELKIGLFWKSGKGFEGEFSA